MRKEYNLLEVEIVETNEDIIRTSGFFGPVDIFEKEGEEKKNTPNVY